MDPWFPIETDRLLLREFRISDEPDIHEYACDPEVTRYTDWGPNMRDITQTVLRRWLKEQEHGLDIWYASHRTKKREAADRHDSHRRERRAHPHRPFRLFAKSPLLESWRYHQPAHALIDAAVRRIGLRRVWATGDTRNVGSYRVMEKLGMLL